MIRDSSSVRFHSALLSKVVIKKKSLSHSRRWVPHKSLVHSGDSHECGVWSEQIKFSHSCLQVSGTSRRFLWMLGIRSEQINSKKIACRFLVHLDDSYGCREFGRLEQKTSTVLARAELKDRLVELEEETRALREECESLARERESMILEQEQALNRKKAKEELMVPVLPLLPSIYLCVCVCVCARARIAASECVFVFKEGHRKIVTNALNGRRK